jgi:hypothetical protein
MAEDEATHTTITTPRETTQTVGRVETIIKTYLQSPHVLK